MKKIHSILPVFVLILLLTHPALSVSGAQNGLLLWFNIVLPTLLPFMLCSGLIVAWGGVPLLGRPLSPLLTRLGFSPEGIYALLTGLLCGYPMGAKNTADFLRSHRIRKEEGFLLLAVSGCPSPMFLSGYVRSHLDPSVSFAVILAGIYLPIPLMAAAARIVYGVKKNTPVRAENLPGHISFPSEKVGSVPGFYEPRRNLPETSFDEILMNSLEIMVRIGGYIMLYSILAAFVSSLKLPAYPELLLGFIEMTTGINAISLSSQMHGHTAAAAITAAAAFGGLSGVSQTETVIKNAGLSIRHYVFWKLIHASLAYIIVLLS